MLLVLVITGLNFNSIVLKSGCLARALEISEATSTLRCERQQMRQCHIKMFYFSTGMSLTAQRMAELRSEGRLRVHNLLLFTLLRRTDFNPDVNSSKALGYGCTHMPVSYGGLRSHSGDSFS
jgi:hypothetical protein